MLDLKDVSITFHPGTVNERKALDHVSLHLDPGDFVCVLGSNGAGKSTLLNAVSGTLPIDEGSIILDGMDLSKYPFPLYRKTVSGSDERNGTGYEHHGKPGSGLQPREAHEPEQSNPEKRPSVFF